MKRDKIKQKIDVGKISEEEGKMIAKELLENLKRDWNNPQIRADYEKWLKNKEFRSLQNEIPYLFYETVCSYNMWSGVCGQIVSVRILCKTDLSYPGC